MEKKLMENAKRYAPTFDINEDTIKVERFGRDLSVHMGDVEQNGFKINIYLYDDSTIDRIIVTAGKNRYGTSLYSETREQEVLDSFLSTHDDTYTFIDWAYKAFERIEDMDARDHKKHKEGKKVV